MPPAPPPARPSAPRAVPPAAPLRLGYVTGATPDKWARAWRERRREPLELVALTEAEQADAVTSARVDLAIVREPVEVDGVHRVRLYEEVPVVVAAADHMVAAADEVTLADLEDEQLLLPHRSGWTPTVPQLEWPAMSEQDAVATAASGAGICLLPMSVARLWHRKDAVHRPVVDLEPTTVALVWRVERDGEDVQTFVGITKGRTPRSTR